MPSEVKLRGLTTQDGRLILYGPGVPVYVGLVEWRKGVRLQRVAFELAKVLVEKWREDRGDSIPVHRLFPQMLEIASRFIEERASPVEPCTKQDLAINPYFGKAVAMLVNSLVYADHAGVSQERAVFESGASRISSTRQVDFHTGKELHDVLRCHLNAAVFDSDWERQAADLLGVHPVVRAWVQNDRLVLVIPYRKEGALRKYLPDFVVELVNGHNLVVEIKGQVGDALIKKAAAERWCQAVTNHGLFGTWTDLLGFGAEHLLRELDKMQRKE